MFQASFLSLLSLLSLSLTHSLPLSRYSAALVSARQAPLAASVPRRGLVYEASRSCSRSHTAQVKSENRSLQQAGKNCIQTRRTFLSSVQLLIRDEVGWASVFHIVRSSYHLQLLRALVDVDLGEFGLFEIL